MMENYTEYRWKYDVREIAPAYYDHIYCEMVDEAGKVTAELIPPATNVNGSLYNEPSGIPTKPWGGIQFDRISRRNADGSWSNVEVEK